MATDIIQQSPCFSLVFEENYGTNPGGWYRDNETGDRKYVKIYENPDQTRVEVLANILYDTAGIPAAHSVLSAVGGRLAIVSDEVVGSTLEPYGPHQVKILQSRPEFIDGALADMWLGNYDVIGCYGDNVVQQPNGTVVRIDNGGSMHFRARGKIKPFPHDRVPELEGMRDPNVIPMSNPSIAQSTAGRVFHILTDAAIADQASRLFYTVTKEVIEDRTASVNFDPETRKRVTETLLGRRAYLMEHYDL